MTDSMRLRVQRVAAQRLVWLDAIEGCSSAADTLAAALREAEADLWPEYGSLRDDLVLALVRDGRGEILTVERLLSDALAYVWLRGSWLYEQAWCGGVEIAFSEAYRAGVVARARARYAEWMHDEPARVAELEMHARRLRQLAFFRERSAGFAIREYRDQVEFSDGPMRQPAVREYRDMTTQRFSSFWLGADPLGPLGNPADLLPVQSALANARDGHRAPLVEDDAYNLTPRGRAAALLARHDAASCDTGQLLDDLAVPRVFVQSPRRGALSRCRTLASVLGSFA